MRTQPVFGGAEAGRLGGLSTSERKVAAARLNGKRGGRRRTQAALGDCLTCGPGTPATETITESWGDVTPYCADCATQVRHLMKVAENRRAGARKAAATRRLNRETQAAEWKRILAARDSQASPCPKCGLPYLGVMKPSTESFMVYVHEESRPTGRRVLSFVNKNEGEYVPEMTPMKTCRVGAQAQVKA
jgi:hypothetical protein